MVCLHGRTTIHRHVGIAIKSIVNSDQHHPHSWSRRVLVHRLRRIYHRYLSRHRHSGLFFSSAETDLTPRADQRINYTPLMDNDLLCQSGHFLYLFIRPFGLPGTEVIQDDIKVPKYVRRFVIISLLV